MPASSSRFEPKGPVDWALGKVFFETILKPIVYLVLPDRVDPRDWMRVEPIQLPLTPNGSSVGATFEDYWFDFVADTGDSDVGAYSLGYLMHGDLAVADALEAAVIAGNSPEWKRPFAISEHDGDATPAVLPRGQFLFVGGDTAYPVADWRQVYDRFTLPMSFAFEQRFADQKAPEDRPLLGIPGNHDWYDNLDGFNRTFRSPTTADVQPSSGGTASTIPKGHRATQQGSYFSLPLPGGWEIWALDARDGPDMDHRQRSYFTELPTPTRVLLATPNPPVVDGRQGTWVEDLWAHLPAAAQQAVSLWFSGDTHHYARYEGVSLPNGRSITSLVSGLGGAALHAPRRSEKEPAGKRNFHTSGPNAKQKPHASLHPSVPVAESAVVGRLRDPRYMTRRPGLRRLGAVFAVCLGIGSLQTHSEVAPLLDRMCGMKEPASYEWPLILLALAVGVRWAVYKVGGTKQTETQARKRSRANRLFNVAWRGLFMVVVFAGITLLQSRTFGSAVADLGFELASLALLGGVGALFHVGVPETQRSFPRMLALWLTALALGALTIAGSVAGARAGNYAAAHCLGLQGDWLKLAPLVALLLVGFGGWALFPSFAGFALVAAFKLGTQRAFVSSFAAVDNFQAFIRFRLRVDKATQRGSLTGFVISVSRGVTKEQLQAANLGRQRGNLVPSAELIDIFTIS